MRFALVLAMVFSALAVTLPPTGAGQVLPGDCNESGAVDINDAVMLVSYLFAGGASPGTIGRINCDCDNNPGITAADAYYLAQQIFDPMFPLFYACGTSITQTGRTFVYTEYTADGTTGSNLIKIYIKTHPDEDIVGFHIPFSYASEPGEAVVDVSSIDYTE